MSDHSFDQNQPHIMFRLYDEVHDQTHTVGVNIHNDIHKASKEAISCCASFWNISKEDLKIEKFRFSNMGKGRWLLPLQKFSRS